MSDIILDPNIDTPTTKKEQLDFFFSQFTMFLNSFKDVYKLKKISPEINEIYDLVKIFIKDFGDCFSKNQKISSREMKKFISKNYKGGEVNNNSSLKKFIEPKLISFDKNSCSEKQQINKAYNRIVRMVGNAERERDCLLSENTIPNIPSFYKKKVNCSSKNFKNCIKE